MVARREHGNPNGTSSEGEKNRRLKLRIKKRVYPPRCRVRRTCNTRWFTIPACTERSFAARSNEEKTHRAALEWITSTDDRDRAPSSRSPLRHRVIVRVGDFSSSSADFSYPGEFQRSRNASSHSASDVFCKNHLAKIATIAFIMRLLCDSRFHRDPIDLQWYEIFVPLYPYNQNYKLRFFDAFCRWIILVEYF